MAAPLASHEQCHVGMKSALVGAALDSGIGNRENGACGPWTLDFGLWTLDFRGKGIRIPAPFSKILSAAGRTHLT